MTDFVLVGGAERRHRKRELLKLMAARSDFSGARHAAQMLLEHAPQIGSDLNYPLHVATIVCYVRPFTANEPYGAIPARYVRGLEPHLRQIHDEALDARHRFFAHSDLSDRGAFIFPAGALVGREPKEIRASGLGSALNYALYSPDFIRELGHLSSKMFNAVSADIDTLLKELYSGMDLPKSKFRLKVDNGL